MKTYRGVEVYLHAFLTAALDGGEWSASCPAVLLVQPGKNYRYPLDRRLGEPQSWSGHGGEKERSLPLPGIEPRSSSPITVQTCSSLSTEVRKVVIILVLFCWGRWCRHKDPKDEVTGDDADIHSVGPVARIKQLAQW
jgi:hypothetical protein